MVASADRSVKWMVYFEERSAFSKTKRFVSSNKSMHAAMLAMLSMLAAG